MTTRRILFVEPFYGGSHRAFLDGLVGRSRHELVPLTLPAAAWRRRMRSGAQELATASEGLTGTFDAIIATDMLDLPLFLALTRPRFDRVPVLLYFHENQFTYPRIRGEKLDSWFGAINYHSALAANRVAFNSTYHRDDFLGALRTLTAQPNNWLLAKGIDTIATRSTVLPVGVDLARLDPHRPPGPAQGAPLVLWNHRWEFDKAPETFARAIDAVAAQGLAFRLALAGEPGLNPHPALAQLRDRFPDRVVQFGMVEDDAAFARLLWAADIVVSTTWHEFFGVGMVEALNCECLPVAPARYNYPALVPGEWHERCLWNTEDELIARLSHLLASPPPVAAGEAMRRSAQRFDWSRVAPQWDAAIDDLARHSLV